MRLPPDFAIIHRRSYVRALVRLGFALVLSFAGYELLRKNLGYIAKFLGYRASGFDYFEPFRAQLAAIGAYAALAFSASISLTAGAARDILALPPVPRPRWHAGFTVFRVIAAIVLMIWLFRPAGDEFFARYPNARLYMLGAGLLFCAMFCYDIPRLLRNARGALSARLLLRFPRLTEIGAGSTSRRAAVTGTILEPDHPITHPEPFRFDAYDSRYVFLEQRRATADVGYRGYSFDEEVKREATEFRVALDSGEQVLVSATTEQFVVSAKVVIEASGSNIPHHSMFGLRVGDRVTLLGELEAAPGEGYRGGIARLGPHQGQLFAISRPKLLAARFIAAGLIELGAAAGLSACLGALLVVAVAGEAVLRMLYS